MSYYPKFESNLHGNTHMRATACAKHPLPVTPSHLSLQVWGFSCCIELDAFLVWATDLGLPGQHSVQTKISILHRMLQQCLTSCTQLGACAFVAQTCMQHVQDTTTYHTLQKSLDCDCYIGFMVYLTDLGFPRQYPVEEALNVGFDVGRKWPKTATFAAFQESSQLLNSISPPEPWLRLLISKVKTVAGVIIERQNHCLTIMLVLAKPCTCWASVLLAIARNTHICLALKGEQNWRRWNHTA